MTAEQSGSIKVQQDGKRVVDFPSCGRLHKSMFAIWDLCRIFR